LEGLGSRRQSNVPYPTTDDSSSQCGGSSPIPRTLHTRKLERSPVSLTESVSKTTLDNVSVQEEEAHRRLNIKSVDDLFINTGPKLRKNARALSIIASSSSSDYPFQTVIRGSRSLDPLPTDMYNKRFESPNFWKENECTRINSKADISEKMLNNNYPNGNVITMFHTVDSPPNEADPLLGDDSADKREIREKRSLSLDQVVSASSMDSVPDKKSSARKLLEIPPVSTIIQMFNGNGLRNSNVSLRRGILAGYDKQNERESVV